MKFDELLDDFSEACKSADAHRIIAARMALTSEHQRVCMDLESCRRFGERIAEAAAGIASVAQARKDRQ